MKLWETKGPVEHKILTIWHVIGNVCWPPDLPKNFLCLAKRVDLRAWSSQEYCRPSPLPESPACILHELHTHLHFIARCGEERHLTVQLVELLGWRKKMEGGMLGRVKVKLSSHPWITSRWVYPLFVYRIVTFNEHRKNRNSAVGGREAGTATLQVSSPWGLSVVSTADCADSLQESTCLHWEKAKIPRAFAQGLEPVCLASMMGFVGPQAWWQQMISFFLPYLTSFNQSKIFTRFFSVFMNPACKIPIRW